MITEWTENISAMLFNRDLFGEFARTRASDDPPRVPERGWARIDAQQMSDGCVTSSLCGVLFRLPTPSRGSAITTRGCADDRASASSVNDNLMGYIDELKEAIRNLHGCEADHAGTVPVKEVFQGQTVWEGDVEVFNIRGHPKANRAYAWAHETAEGKRYVAVLEVPPVNSAQRAVRAAIVDEARKQKGK